MEEIAPSKRINLLISFLKHIIELIKEKLTLDNVKKEKNMF